MIQGILYWLSILVIIVTLGIHFAIAATYSGKPGELTTNEWFWRLMFQNWSDYNFIVIYLVFGFIIWRTV